MNQVQEIEGRGFVPWADVMRDLDCCSISLKRYCERHNIPIAKLSPKKRGLKPEHYRLLLARAAGQEAKV